MNNYENLLKDNQNYFYDSINSYIKTKSENTLIELLDKSLTSETLSTTQFKVLGGLAYLLGIDFTSQRNKANSVVLFNVNERYKIAGVTKTVIDKFFKVIETLDINKLEAPKELIINKIDDKLPTNDAIQLSLISNLAKELTVPVGFALQTYKIATEKIITYRQLLTINGIVYENADFTGEIANNNLIPLLQSPSWGKCIKEASEYFEMQKYALIYFDSIITVKEFILSKPEVTDWVFNEALIAELKKTDSEVMPRIESLTEVEEVIEESFENNSEATDVSEDGYRAVEADYAGQYSSPNEVDVFVQGFMNEILFNNMGGRTIEKPQDIFDVVNYMINDSEETGDETLAQFYMYIKKNQNAPNRINFDDVYTNMNFIAFKNELDNYLISLRDEYKTLVEEIITPIPPHVLARVVELIRNVIKKLTFSVDSQNKAYLIQQLVENQVETYKHLEQIQNIIDSCYIQVKYTPQYEELYNYIKSNESIVSVFENAPKVDNAKYRLQAFSGLHDFFCQTKDEESLLVVK